MTGLAGMMATVNLSASAVDTDTGWFKENSPYVTVRGGWLFGKAKYNEHMDGVGEWNVKDSIKSAWSGSGEFGVSCHDDRVFVGLELGYFTGKMKVERNYDPVPHVVVPAGASPLMPGGGTIDLTKVFGDGKISNFFGACNVTLRHDLNDRAFLYGGAGAGIARSRIHGNVKMSMLFTPAGGVAFTRQEGGDCGKSKWRFLGQACAGLGVYLNESWQLTAGYRLRYVPGSFEWCETLESGQKWSWKVKQDIIHAAEVGLTYQF